ncbi:hypothetical protein AB7M17_001466 [Bradyrhizobium sp. USDA 377]
MPKPGKAPARAVDADHFKLFNDHHGQQTACLRVMLRQYNTHIFFSKSRNFSGARLNIDKSLPGAVFALMFPCPSPGALTCPAEPGPAIKTNR